MAALASRARSDYLKDAFEKFASVIRPNDDRLFRDTTLEDVRTAARVIERDQHQRRCQRNLRRIEPVLDALRKLGVALEPLSQGVPYLCYIWAPLKLLLQIADEYTKGFEQLLDAYAEIAKHLPRFDRLSLAFQDQPDFQAVLADIYSDILEFHTHAYRFLRRSGWKHLFDSTWKSFGTRFNAILQRLARGQDLIDREALSFDILQAKAFRQTLLVDVERQENARRDWQLRDTIAWLDLKGQDLEQQDLFERRVATREPNTCEWLLHHAKIMTWLDQDDPRHFLWLRGKPGSGKTTLASFLIQQGSFPSKSTVIYCLCSYGFGKVEKNACNLALRSILAQVIRQKADILDHVYDNYVRGASLPALSKVRLALKECLYAIGSTFLVIDGLDECEPTHQNQLLSELIQMSEPDDPLKLKVLICSRESKEIKRKIGNNPVLLLREEKDCISKDIALFTKKNLQELKSRFPEDVIDSIAAEVVSRADGMFLWVHLIIGTLLDQESEIDLRQTLKSLPTKLPDVYKSILSRLDYEADYAKIRRINNILSCLAFAVRPLKLWEVCDLVTLHEEDGVINEQTKLGFGVLDICKPLIEEQDGQVVSLVHFSAREFLLHEYSGPRLNESQAQRNLTSACLRYLMTCKDFRDEQTSSSRHGDIVKGYHDLFPYVYENWLDHLQQYRRCAAIDGSLASLELTNLLHQLARAVERHSEVERGRDNDRINSRPSEFDMPIIIQNLLSHRQTVSKTQRMMGFEDPEMSAIMTDDPTTLSSAYAYYQTAFESLLESPLPFTLSAMNVSEEQLHHFRTRHSQFAYLCRHHGCVRASTGFPTLLERKRHELSHRPQYHCEDPACTGADGAFNTKSSLKRHMERYHRKMLVDTTLPEFPIMRITSGKTPNPEKAAHVQTETTSAPANHSTRALDQQNGEYLEELYSLAGEAKINRNGRLKGGREYEMRTFSLSSRGDKLFMFTSECVALLGYSDANAMFDKAPSIQLFVLRLEEIDELLSQPTLSGLLTGKTVVTARSMFCEFGSRVIKNGQSILDDYWELPPPERHILTEREIGNISRGQSPSTLLPDRSVQKPPISRPTEPRPPKEQYLDHQRAHLMALGVSESDIEDQIEVAWSNMESESWQQFNEQYEAEMKEYHIQMDLYHQSHYREREKLIEESQLPENIAAVLAWESHFEMEIRNATNSGSNERQQRSAFFNQSSLKKQMLVKALTNRKQSQPHIAESAESSVLCEWVRDSRSVGSGRFTVIAHGYVNIVNTRDGQYLAFCMTEPPLRDEPETALRASLDKNGTSCDRYGRTLLAGFCSMGDVNAVKARIVTHTEELFYADDTGKTPLHIAASAGFVHVLEILLRADARVETIDGFGFTPLASAVTNGHIEVARMLLNNGANPKRLKMEQLERLVLSGKMSFWEMQALEAQINPRRRVSPYLVSWFSITGECGFRKADASIIRFNGCLNDSMALYFKDSSEMDDIWTLLDQHTKVLSNKPEAVDSDGTAIRVTKDGGSIRSDMRRRPSLEPSQGPIVPISYWSPQEIARIPGLVEKWGRDYTAIADALRTKTSLMVKTYLTSEARIPTSVANATDARNSKVSAVSSGSYPVIVIDDPDEYGTEEHGETKPSQSSGAHLSTSFEFAELQWEQGTSSDHPIDLDDYASSPENLEITPSWNSHERRRFWYFVGMYGQDWKFIADALGTKDEKMVARFYDQEVAVGKFGIMQKTPSPDSRNDTVSTTVSAKGKEKETSQPTEYDPSDLTDLMVFDTDTKTVRRALPAALRTINNGVETIDPTVLSQVLSPTERLPGGLKASPQTTPRNPAQPTERELLVSKILDNPEDFFSRLPPNLRDHLNALPPVEWLAVLQRYEEGLRKVEIPARWEGEDDAFFSIGW